MSGFGTTDMAGNVKEWCWNEGREGKRFILGGGFGEPTYMFAEHGRAIPWDRGPNYGFRCVKLDSPATAGCGRENGGHFPRLSRRRSPSPTRSSRPTGTLRLRQDDAQRAGGGDGDDGDWTREKVSFNAAYGSERMALHLFLPKKASPPFQAVVYFPGWLPSLDDKFVPSLIEDVVDFFRRAAGLSCSRSTRAPSNGGTASKPGGNPPAVVPRPRDHVVEGPGSIRWTTSRRARTSTARSWPTTASAGARTWRRSSWRSSRDSRRRSSSSGGLLLRRRSARRWTHSTSRRGSTSPS